MGAPARRRRVLKASSGPGVAALLALGATPRLAAAASACRCNLRVLEKALPPAGAALVAAVAYGSGALWAGTRGIQELRALPAPLPTRTIGETAEQARSLT